MANVSTQTVTEANPVTLTAQAMADMSQVDMYKQLLTAGRLSRVSLVAKIDDLIANIQNLMDNHQSLIEEFKAKAVQMYPELQGQNLKTVIGTLAADHPLVQLWNTYAGNLNQGRNAIQVKMQNLDEMMAQNSSLLDQEQANLSSYALFYNQATTKVPTPDELVLTLAQVSVIPSVTQVSNIVSLPAIEELDSEAASMVMLQAVQAGEAGVDLAVSVQDTPPGTVAAPRQIPKAVLYGVGAILFLAIFGGKKAQ